MKSEQFQSKVNKLMLGDSHKVFIVQIVIPNYRVALFRALSLHPELKAVIIASKQDFLAPENLTEVSYQYVPVYQFYHGQLTYLHLPKLLYRAPVVILNFDLRILSLYPVLLWRKLTNRATILWGHGLSNRKKQYPFVSWIRSRLAHWASALIFYDEVRRQQFVNLGVSAEKLFLASNTIDTIEIKEARDSLPRQPRTQILFIGRLIKTKKVDLLIEAFAQIVSQLSTEMGVLIIGSGPEETSLKALANELGLAERIHFMGEIVQETRLAPLFAQAVLCVSPGYIGLSAIHSLAYGVPLLVASDEEHSPEVAVVIQDKTGVFYAPNTPEAMAKALLHLLSDRDRLELMGEQGRQLVEEKYTIQNMVAGFEAAVEYALAQRS